MASSVVMEAASRRGVSEHHPAKFANRPGDPTFAIQMLNVRGQLLRVGRQPGSGSGVPLLMFNGIGGSIELLEPLARSMPAREVIVFDVPGVGHSPMPRRPYRLRTLARWAEGVLDQYGHAQADVLGVSWGGRGGAGVCAQRERTLPATDSVRNGDGNAHGARASEGACEDGHASPIHEQGPRHQDQRRHLWRRLPAPA
jgi:pimeloyl-ACP methyl ester carboxylesterase